MELIIIGSGTCVPSLTRGSSAVIVKVEGKTILVDSGAGTIHKLLKLGITYNEIDIICFTHIHPDHISDIIPFLFSCKYGETPRKNNLTIIGGEGFLDFFFKLQELFNGWISPAGFQIDFKELVDKEYIFKNISITTCKTAHIKESIGFRFEDKNKRSVVVSGDTDYSLSLVELAKNTDILLLECSYPDNMKVKGHLAPSLAARIAKESTGCYGTKIG